MWQFIFGDTNSCVACSYFVLRAYVYPGTADNPHGNPTRQGQVVDLFCKLRTVSVTYSLSLKMLKKKQNTFLARGLSRNRPQAACGPRAMVCWPGLRCRPARHPTAQTGNRDLPACRWETCSLTTTLPLILATTSLCFYPLPCSNFWLVTFQFWKFRILGEKGHSFGD